MYAGTNFAIELNESMILHKFIFNAHLDRYNFVKIAFYSQFTIQVKDS